MKYLFPVFITAGTLIAAAAGAAGPAGPDTAVAAVFPPWWGREQAAAAVAAAGALIVREGIAGSIVVVRADGARLAERLHDNGALLLLSPQGLGGCLFAS